jgi:hypothetical protein
MGAIVWVIVLRTGKEERLLVERFGSEYVAYMRRTTRYLPRPWAHRAGASTGATGLASPPTRTRT